MSHGDVHIAHLKWFSLQFTHFFMLCFVIYTLSFVLSMFCLCLCANDSAEQKNEVTSDHGALLHKAQFDNSKLNFNVTILLPQFYISALIDTQKNTFLQCEAALKD